MKACRHLSSVFPGASAYAALIEKGSRDCVRERRASFFPSPCTERHLQCVWYDPVWRPRALETIEGESVRVQNPGRWNREPGPDFLDAVLVVGTNHRIVHGDVEVDVHPSEWAEHGHSGNPRYGRVVAHVTYFSGGSTRPSLPPGAVRIALHDALRANPAFSFDLIDLSAYPYATPPATATPCAEVFAAWSPAQQAAFLEAAGQERLRQKATRLAHAIVQREPEQVLYEEILAVLGYKQNRHAFRELASRVPLAALREVSGGNPVVAFALLLGVAGLLPKKMPPHADSGSRRWLRSLWDQWWKLASVWSARILPADMWNLAGVRPVNHPVRRLAAAASWFAPPDVPWKGLEASPLIQQPARWVREASAAFQTLHPSLQEWTRRYHFAAAPVPRPVALVGPGRIASLLVNALLPFLTVLERDITPLLAHLPDEEENVLVRQTAHRLLGHDHPRTLRQGTLRQQGLLQVFHDFCLGSRAGCRDCPLVQAVRRLPKGFPPEAGHPACRQRRNLPEGGAAVS